MAIEDKTTTSAVGGAKGDRRLVVTSVAMVAIGMVTCLLNRYAAGVGAVAIVTGVTHYQRAAAKRLRWWQVTLALIAIFIAVVLLYVLAIALIAIARARH